MFEFALRGLQRRFDDKKSIIKPLTKVNQKSILANADDGDENPCRAKDPDNCRFHKGKSKEAEYHKKVEAVRERFRSLPSKISKQKQDAHVKGSKEYNRYANDLKSKGLFGPSYVTISVKEAQRLIDKYSGTGTIKLNNNGTESWETILNNDIIVGYVVNNTTGEETPTTVFKIHHKKTGTHLVPDYPSKKKAR
jgi:hypothetical protein